jgi:Replication-relaxation
MRGNDHHRLVVQARDRHLLEELAVMRVLDREQVKIVAGFGSTTRANARLLALTRVGLLRRFFLGTTGGGQKALYALSSKGAQLVGVPLRAPRRRKDESLIADFVVQHQLIVNEIYCAVKYQPLNLDGFSFRRWIAFHEPVLPGLRLIPDGYAEWQTPTGVQGAFLEVDLGHEGLTIWKEKVRNYLQLALSGECERRFSQSRFRILVIAPSERRLRSIRTTVVAATQKVFWFASLEAIRANGFFASVWLRPTGEERMPLL